MTRALGSFDAAPSLSAEPKFIIDLVSEGKTVRLAIRGRLPNRFKNVAYSTLSNARELLQLLIAEDAHTPQPDEPEREVDPDVVAQLRRELDEAKAAAEAAPVPGPGQEDPARAAVIAAELKLEQYLGPDDMLRFIRWYFETDADDRKLAVVIDAICRELSGHPLERFAPVIASSLGDQPGGPDTSEPPTESE